MKKVFLTFIFISLIVWSCNDVDETENNAQQKLPMDVKIEEITSSVNNQKSGNVNHELKTQIDSDFRDFTDRFPHYSLPYELKPDFEKDADNIYAKIPLEKQIKYLSKVEKLKKADFEEMAEYTDFYFVGSPLQTSNFTAIVYGRFEMGSVYFYLCTFNNKGDLISSIDFASLEMLGAGPQAGQYIITKGKIDKNFKVTVSFNDMDGYTTTKNYQIMENGSIEKI